MVGITLSSDELQTIFEILGLNDENQSKVYLSLLSVGALTLGQISQLTGLHYIEVRDAIEVLVGSDYVNWTTGKINRYFAREPFLKAFMLTYDTFTLFSIRDEAKKRISAFEKDFQDRLNPLFSQLSNEHHTTLQKAYDFIKRNLESQQTQIDNEISALNYSISEMKKQLKFVFNLSSKMNTQTKEDLSGLTTDLVFGETTFLLLLKDITSRTKVSLTVLMPYPEIQTLMSAIKLPLSVRSRTFFVGDFSQVPQNILNKVMSSQVTLRETPLDFMGCIRDKEEILFGLSPQNTQHEEIVGITSTNPSMVHFFGQQFQSYSTSGKNLTLN